MCNIGFYPSDGSSTGKPIKLSSKAYLIPSLPGIVIQHLIMQSRPSCNGKHPRPDDITAVGSSHAKATVGVLLNRADETHHCQLPIVQSLIEQLLIEQLLIEQLLIEKLLIEQSLIEQLLIEQLLIEKLLIEQSLIEQLLFEQLLIEKLLIEKLLIEQLLI